MPAGRVEADGQEDRRFYGRRRGRPLRPRMQQLLDERLDALRVTVDPDRPTRVDPFDLFDRRPSAVWLEIGFGGGEHLAWQAAANPQVGIIGCEPFLNGVASLLRHLEDGGLTNVRILADDARPLLDSLPDGVLDRIFVLHPDPWPKRRHHDRRLIQHATIDRFHALLRPGGELRLATDDADYRRWMLARVTAHAGLAWTGRRIADWRTRPDDWPQTRYEAKALRQGREPAYLRFVRR